LGNARPGFKTGQETISIIRQMAQIQKISINEHSAVVICA
jgi:hypothetical protein